MNSESLFLSRQESCLMLADDRRLGHPKPEHFEPRWWQGAGRVIGEAKGRGSAWFLNIDTEQWVLRHYRRGGMVSRWVEDTYLYTGAERSRPFRELRLLRAMEARGLPVPAPVGACLSRQGLLYRADLISVRVPGQPLSKRLMEGDSDPGLFRRVGEVIGRFHAEGIFHADLNAHNILVEGECVHLIDFDRSQWRRPGHWQRRNLERLQRSVKKILASDWAEEAQWQQAWLALEQGWRDVIKKG
ncbi:3-deoxy-D-manno-octulosonic acid kinase [Natronospira sp.]|uniref:3-deoxy-D-manno-octulosonic acid kinase n=1 Tax=Natronospira sp. TaxID=2024970 RepID=UPI003872E630